jgi:soluble lytic murein transglycosylase-like protein
MSHSASHGPGSIASLAVFVLSLFTASAARAELVYFASGRTMSVKGHRAEGDQLVLELREAGEIVCDASTVSRIAPDEIPYPEPVAATPVVDAPPAYAEIIDAVSKEQGVDARLVKAVIQVESGYQRRARSPKGAMGLMQLMPETARQYAVSDPYDPRANIEAGIRHLKSLLERFPLALALAAYNAGEAAVARFGGLPPYTETRSYVSQVLALLGAAAAP